jgi:hypothetical protein
MRDFLACWITPPNVDPFPTDLWRISGNTIHLSITPRMIEDIDETIFGGYTPPEWKALKSHYDKEDENVKSFLFTLQNPHNVPPQKFAPETEEKHRTLNCFPYAKELSARGWFCQIWSA